MDVYHVFDVVENKRYLTLLDYFDKNKSKINPKECESLEKIFLAEAEKMILTVEEIGIVISAPKANSKQPVSLQIMPISKASEIYTDALKKSLTAPRLKK